VQKEGKREIEGGKRKKVCREIQKSTVVTTTTSRKNSREKERKKGEKKKTIFK
jgi:hypothetical protein